MFSSFKLRIYDIVAGQQRESYESDTLTTTGPLAPTLVGTYRTLYSQKTPYGRILVPYGENLLRFYSTSGTMFAKVTFSLITN